MTGRATEEARALFLSWAAAWRVWGRQEPAGSDWRRVCNRRARQCEGWAAGVDR